MKETFDKKHTDQVDQIQPIKPEQAEDLTEQEKGYIGLIIGQINKEIKAGDRVFNLEFVLEAALNLKKPPVKQIPGGVVEAVVAEFKKAGWDVKCEYNWHDGTLMEIERKKEEI
jgi:hypothetical protein